jgi:hypothetical protein
MKFLNLTVELSNKLLIAQMIKESNKIIEKDL